MADVSGISGTDNAYVTQYYSAGTNDKNTLTIESFFQLLATQLANQDMTNPMSNSEMMQQLTQMAMIQSISTMTDAITTSTNITTQTYAAGLVGQEVTMAVVDDNGNPTGVKYGIVESVSLVNGVPIVRLEGDDTDYSLGYIVGMGKIDDPYAEKPEEPEEPEGTE